jgi:hypothetical protein
MTYSNSRASLLDQTGSKVPKKKCSLEVVQLFRTLLCREAEASAYTYLSAHTCGTDLAKLETAIKHSSECRKGERKT